MKIKNIKNIKTKQLALVVATFVIMLAIWFVKSPLLASNNNLDDNLKPVDGDVSVFESLREAVLEQRAIETASWDMILADETATLASKQTALNQKTALSDLTEKEVLLEVEVINMGYEDAFVHCTSDGVEVYVMAEEESATAALEIISAVQSKFTNAENIVINFKTE